MILTYGEGLIFVALMVLAIVIMQTGNHIVEAIRERGKP